MVGATEGASDARYLRRSLDLLSPDVSEYFRFLDFDTNIPGGTDQVVKSLRSFAAAGIVNRVIALLDNDAAGRQAEKILSERPLPRNFAVLRLPELEYARSYPTLGPSGGTQEDVNQRACSIEFYFGLDCLHAGNGDVVPVRWTGYNRAIMDYQGELVDKKLVQSRISELLTLGENHKIPLDQRWDPMRTVISLLTTAGQQLSRRLSSDRS